MQGSQRTGSRRLLLGCLVTALACGLAAAPVSAQSERRSAQSASERPNYFQSAAGPIIYVPTKATVIDPKTHKARKPTTAEVDAIMVTIKPMANQSEASVVSTKGPDGARRAIPDESFDNVLLARPNADGTFETRCVSSFAEAVQFLGLEPVPAGSSAAKRFLNDTRNAGEE